MRALALRSSGTARPGPNTFSRRRRIMALLPAPEAGRYPGSVTYPSASTRSPPRPGRAARPGKVLPNPSATSACWLRQQTSSVGEHDRQQPCGRAGQGGCGMGPVIGLDGGEDGFSTARTWHSSGVPWLCQGRADVRRGHKHPHGKKRLLRNGPDLEDALIVEIRVPRPSAGCSWPALTGGLWHF